VLRHCGSDTRISCDLREGKKTTTTTPAIWSFGIDISVGKLIAANVEDHVCSDEASFAKVGEDFKCKTGQKVRIAIHFTEKYKPTLKTLRAGMTVDRIEAFYGKPNQVNIYTGKITHVSSRHIEYDINTCEGCSWAIVFLLDQKRPESVGPSNCGKAVVAVHAGTLPSLTDRRNFGFLINEHPVFKSSSSIRLRRIGKTEVW
jgi:hypothetical protein